MIQKITFINPPILLENQSGSFKSITNVIPPLGIIQIASVLEKSKFKVKVIDSVLLNYSYFDIEREILRFNPEVIAITSTVISINSAMRLAKYLRLKFADKILIIGGPHFSTLPDRVMENSPFNFGVLNEGEDTLLELMVALRENKTNFDDIKGLVFYKDGKLTINSRRNFIDNLNELPFPARHLLPDLKFYKPMVAGFKRFPLAHIVSSRGCPYNCIFCDRTVFGNKIRSRNAQNIIQEIKQLQRNYKVKEIKFYDDYFTFSKIRIYELCSEIVSKNIDITWSCSTRVDGIEKNLLEKMKSAGCWQIDFGIESGVQSIIDSMKKNFTIEQIERAVKLVKESGIKTRAFFVFGMPDETIETIRKTVKFAIKLNLDVVTFYTISVYPGTELFSIIQKENGIIHYDYDYYSSVIDLKKTKFHYLPRNIKDFEFRREIKRAYLRYYLRCKFIFQQLKSINSILDVKRYLVAIKVILFLR